MDLLAAAKKRMNRIVDISDHFESNFLVEVYPDGTAAVFHRGTMYLIGKKFFARDFDETLDADNEVLQVRDAILEQQPGLYDVHYIFMNFKLTEIVIDPLPYPKGFTTVALGAA